MERDFWYQPATQTQGIESTAHSNFVIPIERPKVPANRLELLAISLRDLHPDHAEVVELGQLVETDRGPQGFDPNTPNFIWQPEGLSLTAVDRVVQNYNLWTGHRWF